MGYVSKAVSLAAIGLFGWHMWNMTRLALTLFYPTSHIPILKPAPQHPPGTPFHHLAWQEPFKHEAFMYVTEMETLTQYPQHFLDAATQVWRTKPHDLVQRHMRIEDHIEFVLPDSFRTTNGTVLYAFLFMQKANKAANPHPDFGNKHLVYARAQLTSIRPHRIDHSHALLGSSKESKQQREERERKLHELENGPWVPHAKTRIHWEIVLDDLKFPLWQFPLDISPYLRVDRQSKQSASPYLPLTWENPLAARMEHWEALTNQTEISERMPLDAQTVKFDVSLTGVILGWFRLCNFVQQATVQFASSSSVFKFSEIDLDNLKEMVYEVNPLMLAITMAAMALHMLFEFLAYKEDVSFWNKEGESEWQGISRSSVLMGVVSSWIGLLYLWDQRSTTSVVVLIGSAVGAVVEGWKLTRLWNLKLFSRKPKTAATAKPKTADENEFARVQREVDQQTLWYMQRVCAPAMIAYAAFSLVYQEHKSYVSWGLHVSLATVYTLEFIQMWPQLMINHKLKSVDMLPLTAFLYRFLVTFTDDLFAMVVPMPLISRIGTLRDDVVFFVLCYQWYKFPRRSSNAEKAEVADTKADAADAKIKSE